MNQITAIAIIILYIAIFLIPIIWLFIRLFSIKKKKRGDIENHSVKKLVLTQDQCLNEIRNDIHNIYKISNFFYGLTIVGICILILCVLITVLNFMSANIG